MVDWFNEYSDQSAGQPVTFAKGKGEQGTCDMHRGRIVQTRGSVYTTRIGGSVISESRNAVRVENRTRELVNGREEQT